VVAGWVSPVVAVFDDKQGVGTAVEFPSHKIDLRTSVN
jgi:hypothetical protein